MNWLIYTMYARQEYKFCKEIIVKQLEENYDQEYLFFIKGIIARTEGELQELLRCLQKTIINPMNYENFKEIGKTLCLLGRWRKALDVVLKSESLLQSADAEVYYYIGRRRYLGLVTAFTLVADREVDYVYNLGNY